MHIKKALNIHRRNTSCQLQSSIHANCMGNLHQENEELKGICLDRKYRGHQIIGRINWNEINQAFYRNTDNLTQSLERLDPVLKEDRNTSLAVNTSFIFLKVPLVVTTQSPQSTLMPHNLTKTWKEISLMSSLSLSECNLFHSFLSHTYEAHIKDSCLILLYLRRRHCPCLLPFSSIAVLSVSSISFCFHYFIYLSASSFGIQLDTGL